MKGKRGNGEMEKKKGIFFSPFTLSPFSLFP
jgi:hypothetical protein